MTEPNEQPKATDAAARRAKELDLDISRVPPSGKQNQVTLSDVDKYIKEEKRMTNEGEERTEKQTTPQTAEYQARISNSGQEEYYLQDDAIDNVDEIVEIVWDRLAQLDQETRMESARMESTQPEVFEEPPEDENDNISNQYKVLRVILSGPRELEDSTLSDPPVFVSDPNKDFAPTIPLADWKPVRDPWSSSPPTSPSNLFVSPQTLAFGSTIVGLPSAGQTVTIVNKDTEAMEIGHVPATGDGTDFKVVNSTCPLIPALLNPGGQCGMTVQFTPTKSGNRSAQIKIVGIKQNPVRVTEVILLLSGVGVLSSPSNLSVSPNPLDFGSTIVGLPAADQTVTIENKDTEAMTISLIPTTGDVTDFKVVNSTCPGNPALLNPGGKCAMTARFTPTKSGNRSAQIKIVGTKQTQVTEVTLLWSGNGM